MTTPQERREGAIDEAVRKVRPDPDNFAYHEHSRNLWPLEECRDCLCIVAAIRQEFSRIMDEEEGG